MESMVTFSEPDLARVETFARNLRSFAGAGNAEGFPRTRERFREMTGSEMIPPLARAMADAIEAESRAIRANGGRSAHDPDATLVIPVAEGDWPEVVAFSRAHPGDIFIDEGDEPVTFSEGTNMIDTERERRRVINTARAEGRDPAAALRELDRGDDPAREARRAANHAWAEARNPKPAPEAKAPDATPSGLAPPRLGDGSPPKIDRVLGLTPEGIEAATAAGVNLEAMARRELARLPGAGSHAFQKDFGTGRVSFVSWIAEDTARRRAVFSAILDGREIDPDEVDREVGRQMILGWWDKRGLSSLVGSASHAMAHYEHVLADRRNRLAGSARAVNQGHFSLEGFFLDARQLNEDVATASRRLGQLRAAVANLPRALASRVVATVELAGGVDKLAGQVREARSLSGSFPGPDPDLDRLKVTLDEATDRLNSLLPPPGEEPGELMKVAEQRRDELVAALKARRNEVAKSSMVEIRRSLDDAMAGRPDAVANLLALVEKHPEAFPGPFRQALASVPLEAALEAGHGFMWCLA